MRFERERSKQVGDAASADTERSPRACRRPKLWCLQSVVQVLDPQVYLRSVKRHLSEKLGVPAEHQRLTFTVAAAVDKAEDAPRLLGSAEGLLSGLGTWQVKACLLISSCDSIQQNLPAVSPSKCKCLFLVAGSGLPQQQVHWQVFTATAVFGVTAWRHQWSEQP